MTAAPPRWTRIEAADGVLLRAPTLADAPGCFAIHGDPMVYRYDPQETHHDLEQTRAFLAPMLTHWAEHGYGYWAVLVPSEVWPEGVGGTEDADGGRVLAGLGGIQHYTMAGTGVLNTYYRFATAVQGRGLARALLTQVLATAPLVAPELDVVVRTRPANAVARHVAERAGFVDEGLEPGTTDMQLLRYRADRL